MKKYIKYLSYIIRHKWYVMLECWKFGMYWRGIMHDMSKMRPSEFFPYANHFYGGGKNIKSGRDETGYYKPTDTGDQSFDYAWLLHQKRNKHHWQWWVLPEDDGGNKVLDIPLKYLREMLCDWRGAGKARGKGDNTKEWYKENKDKMQLSDKTRRAIEIYLFGGVLKK